MNNNRRRYRYHKKNRWKKFLITLSVLLVAIGIVSKWQLIDFLGKPGSNDLSNQTTTEYFSSSEDFEILVPETSASSPSQTMLVEATTQFDEEIEDEVITNDVLEPELTESISTEENSSTVSEDISSDEQTTLEPTGIIYLTFDDGPSTEITPQILDILKEKNVKATFFILDYEVGSERENLIIREINEGHTIGIHGQSHEYSVVYSSLDATVNNFVSLQQKLLDSTGYYSTIIRFPGGSSNTVSKKYCAGVMTASAQALTELGYTYFDWNVDSDDAGSARSSEKILQNVTSALMKGKSNVVLMHDSSNKTYTLGALESIIDYGLENGYEFRAIDSSTPQVKHGISN